MMRKSALSLLVVAATVANAETNKLAPIQIFDSKNTLQETPGSGVVISKENLEETTPLSTQDALRKVPGIQAIETEGYGFYPRITVRGLGSDMSRKVLLLEDGAPVALGPYTDPSAYYSSPIERMESIEVLKGSGTLRFGPSTIGGAINSITRQAPATPGGRVQISSGSQDYQNFFGEYGGTWGEKTANLSVLRKEGDGWRNMPFELTDTMLKAGTAIGEKQFVSIKATHYDMQGRHTYQGLTAAEYDDDHTFNRAVNDKMFIKRSSVDLNHDLELGARTNLKTLAYWNTAQRDWWRQNYSFNAGTGQNQLGTTADGRLRSFDVYGVDSRLLHRTEVAGLKNEIEFGVRYHQEKMENLRVRAKGVRNYSTDGGFTNADYINGKREDDERTAQALALFLEDKIHFTDKLVVVPGVRVETYKQERDINLFRIAANNFARNESSKVSNTEIVPGIGTTYRLTQDVQLFAGVHKGFAPPRVQDAIANDGDAVDLKAERSTNYEIGVRGRHARGNFEATAFRLDFTNQIITQSESGGAGSQSTNAGDTLNQGIELGGDVFLGKGFTLAGNYTWLESAKLTSKRIIGGKNRDGNRLTYAPEHLVNLRLLYTKDKFYGNVGMSHVAEQYADLENTNDESANGRVGKIPSFTIFDLNLGYKVEKNVRLFAAVRNLLDKKYIASRAPEGIFPGMGRMGEVGLEYQF